MKILHIINNLDIGGAENLLSHLLPHFAASEIESYVLMLNGGERNSSFDRWLTEKGIGVFCLSEYGSLYSPGRMMDLRRFLKDKRYDIIHVHLFPSQYFVPMALYGIRGNAKLVTTEHNTLNRRMTKPMFKRIERLVYSKYNRIICVSQGVKDNIVKWLDVHESKCEVITNGIDVELFQSEKGYERDRIDPSLSERDVLIGMVARFEERKDQATVIRALKLLPEYFKLIFIGAGSLLGKHRELVKSLDLDHRVIFMGSREDVPGLLKTMNIGVLSSNWEGFGLAAVEAMASDIPVVATDVEGIKDVVGGAGLLFKQGDEKELARILFEIANDAALRESIIKAQRARIPQYSLDRMAEHYLRMYKSLLEN